MQTSDFYALVMRFPQKDAAGRAFDLVRNLLYLHECCLSGCRLVVEEDWYVVVVGEHPPDELAERLQAVPAFAGGSLASLPLEVLLALDARRRLVLQGREWIEYSYHPPQEGE